MVTCRSCVRNPSRTTRTVWVPGLREILDAGVLPTRFPSTYRYAHGLVLIESFPGAGGRAMVVSAALTAFAAASGTGRVLLRAGDCELPVADCPLAERSDAPRCCAVFDRGGVARCGW